MADKPRSVLNSVQFLRLCDKLREFHEKFARERVSWIEAREFLSKRCGFDVSETNLRTAIAATGCTWEPLRLARSAGHRSLVRATADATIVALNVIKKLYESLGLEVPGEVTGVQERLREATEKANRDREDKRKESAPCDDTTV